MTPPDELADLRRLVDDIGVRCAESRRGHRGPVEVFDDALWRALEDTGLSRLTGQDASAADIAVVLEGIARHAGAVPIAESDVLAGWLSRRVGLGAPGDDTGDGPHTVAIAGAEIHGGRLRGVAREVPWARDCRAVLLVAETPGAACAAVLDSPTVTRGRNLAGEPRDTVAFDLPIDATQRIASDVVSELRRRGAWARCCQVLGALEAVRTLTIDHTRERVQFGRPLSAFQTVGHGLAGLSGEVERTRAAVTLAVAAASEYGFGHQRTDLAVTAAKVVTGQAARSVTAVGHQLHGAIGVTAEHSLWRATMRALSWTDEFGGTAHHARRLGHAALGAEQTWDILFGCS